METKNYKQLYLKMIKSLSDNAREVFDRRFGVKTGSPETLDAIGKDFGITRERVRQIENAGLNIVKKNNKETINVVFQEFSDYFNKNGGLKQEDIAFESLGQNGQKPYVLFFLTLGKDIFSRFCQNRDFDYFWSTMKDADKKADAALFSLASEIEKVGNPISKNNFYQLAKEKLNMEEPEALSYLEISKRIQSDIDGKIGLAEWPEIKPKGVRDMAYLAFKKHGKPVHFVKIASLIDEFGYNDKKTHPQTVHNELIKDPRFILVGRGTYGLAEWGYKPGTIRQVIQNILEESNQPLEKDEIVKKVLEQRLVSKNTVLMNLSNRQLFEKDENNRYFLKNVQTA